MRTDSKLSTSGSFPRYTPPATRGASLEARSYDHWHVDLNERWEIDFWMKHLACEETALRDAVFQVGGRVGAVRAYLASHPQRA